MRTFVTDFDGTLARRDFYSEVLTRIMPSGTPAFYQHYLRGEMTHFECLAAYFGSLRCTESELLEVVHKMELEPGLPGLVEDLRAAGWEVVVASAGCAYYIDRLLADRGVTQVDHIVSGLPLPSFPAEVRDAILGASARALGEHGTFRQLTYMPLVFWQFYRGYFNNVRFQLVPLNIPPAGVYVCRKYKFDRVAA